MSLKKSAMNWRHVALRKYLGLQHYLDNSTYQNSISLAPSTFGI